MISKPFNNRILDSIKSKCEDKPTLLYSEPLEFSVYSRSITSFREGSVFMGRYGGNRFLGVLADHQSNLLHDLEGTFSEDFSVDRQQRFKIGFLSQQNAKIIRDCFVFTRPQSLGVEKNSFGFGDRTGLAGPAHVIAVRETDFQPVFAQQSIREMDRTEREPQEVIDAATWAVLQGGYKEPWGADGDHLKTTEDINRVLDAGFTMLTLDSGEYVSNQADGLSLESLKRRAKNLPWDQLNDSLEGCVRRYKSQTFRFSSILELSPEPIEIYRAICKYGRMISHSCQMHHHLRDQRVEKEIEISVDETESVTSPFEHFFISNELTRLGLSIVSLAPRFPGRFEKGIDYIGDLTDFRSAYLAHAAIAKEMGPYKISLHSGSDKFSVYEEIAAVRRGKVHIKTAGTSFLEALKTVADIAPDFFREILRYSLEHYEEAKQSYHVSGDPQRIPSTNTVSNQQWVDLVESHDDLRQVLHVNFGGVLTTKGDNGESLFRDQLLCFLDQHESTHFGYLEKHFRKHFRAFGKSDATKDSGG